MRGLPFLLLLCACWSSDLRAQLKLQLDYQPDSTYQDLSDRSLIITRYENGALRPVDTVKLPAAEPYLTNVSIPKRYGPGLYVMSVDGQNHFELILNKGEQLTLSGSFKELKDGLGQIGHSFENEAYYQFIFLSSKADAKVKELKDQRLILKRIDPDYYAKQMEIEENLFLVQKKFNQQLDSLRLFYAHTYVADRLIPMAYFPLPSEDEETQYQTNRSFLFEHYFSTMDLSGLRLADNHVFHNRLRYYLQTVTPAEDEYQKQAIDNVLSHAQTTYANFKHVVEVLITYYFSERRDDLVMYVYERYSEDNCAFGEKLQVEEIVAGLKVNRPGDPAQELNLPDTSGNPESLRQTALSNRATVLLFWSSHCSVCLDEIPFLMDMYDRYRDKGLTVYAVNVDDDRNDWTQTVRQLGLNWVNVNESRAKDGSQVERNYKVRQTPASYFIDGQGNIVAKGLFGLELEVELLTYLSTGK